MKVTLACDMWIIQDGDDFVLTPPLATMLDGRPAPGFVKGFISILPEGTTVEIGGEV